MFLHPPAQTTSLALPRGAVDAHVHVFDPVRFPYSPQRSYTPPGAGVDALLSRHAGLGVERAVLVQPSVYGVDNHCLLNALGRLGVARARGIAVLDLDRVRPKDIDALHAAGVRGLRLNLKASGGQDDSGSADARALDAAADVVCRSDWCVQVHAQPGLLTVLGRRIERFESPVVLDHFANLGGGHNRPAAAPLATLLDLLASGRVWVKLSAPYRVSSCAPAHEDLLPLISTLLRAAPHRLVWGSDWPHTGGDGVRTQDLTQVEPFREVDLPATLRSLHSACAGDDDAWRRVLVDNPCALYGFDPTKAHA